MRNVERNGPGRRATDVTDFTQCPKYAHYDLTEDQIDAIIERVHKKAAQDIGEYVIQTGRTMFARLFIIIGLVTLFASWWLSKHGINL
jgi:hypothetical protein